MHRPSWLLLLVTLVQAAFAFYPYHEQKTNKGKAHASRFYPMPLGDGFGTDRPKIPTLNIKKGHPNKPALLARENAYTVVAGSPPTMKNSIPINEDGQDLSYFATFKFGSKGKEMYMLVDTGAANTWVMGSDCTTSACNEHNTFGKEDSSTLTITDESFGITYGTGDVDGVVANDTVSFAGFNLNMGFGLASTTSSDFSTYPMDGILGLGRPKSNVLGTPGVMTTLANAGLLKANLLGVNLQRNSDGATDGEMTFGAWDSSKFDGDILYTDAIDTNGHWEIPVDDAGVDGKDTGMKGRTAIVDTGTSYILLPPPDAKKLHALVPGAQPDGDENWKIPCSSTVPIQFTFSGKTFDVSHKDYLGKADADGKMCQSYIIGRQAFGLTQWLIGDVFLKNVYSVFDFDNDRIGFAVKSTGKANTAPSAASSSSNDHSHTASPSSTSIASSPSAASPTKDTKTSSSSKHASASSTHTISSSASKSSSSSSSSAVSSASADSGQGMGSPFSGDSKAGHESVRIAFLGLPLASALLAALF